MRIESWWHENKLRSSINVSGVRALYLNNLLRGLAGSMVTIFYPAYIYLWGFERGGFVLGIKVLALAVIVERLGVLLLSMSVGKLICKIGFKAAIVISSILFCGWFILPAIFPRSLELILTLSILSAFIIPIYWLARLSILSIEGNKESYGEEVSFLALLDQVTSILGPFVGGIIVSIAGFNMLFGVATFICVLSAIPIFFVGDYKITDGISLSGLRNWLGKKEERHLQISFIGHGLVNTIDAFFWPLYLFLMIGSFTVLGTIASVSFALSSVAIYLAGKIFDRKRAIGGDEDEREYTVATVFLSLIIFLRSFFRSVFSLFGLDAITRMVAPFWAVDHDAYLYSAGKRERSALEFYTYREIIYSASCILGSIILLLFVNQLYFWGLAFGLGSLGILMTLGMKKES